MSANSFAFGTCWGAQPSGEGRAKFRLWAPAQRNAALLPEGKDAPLAMLSLAGGWFELETDAVAVDAGYQFVLDDGMRVPDPASRAQTGDVHGPSRLIDPKAYAWRTPDWKGRPWEEAVVYELHTGTFTPEGTFGGVGSKLDHLVSLGVTALELMPVAQFAGNRGWGYDGVLPYAPHSAYGGPDGLKSLIDAAHQRGLMVLLDVVYNHFGPEGNYLHLYAPQFFHPERQTPWGAAIAFDQEPVRRFFMENALYWLEEFRLDGLRLDAIDQIDDQSGGVPILQELAAAVRDRIKDRHIHLTTEDERNIVSLHQRDEEGCPRLYTAEWNDDIHHAAHVLATGESEGYYGDFSDNPARKLARGLAEGYIYQGEATAYRDGALRGEPSATLPPTAFIAFLQNHDQIGNRAFGERLTALAEPGKLKPLHAILLLSPQIPLLYMGEEWGETRPFFFFTGFEGELAEAVREGRRREFARWPSFQSPDAREKIPDPNAPETFSRSTLDWSALNVSEHAQRLNEVRTLLALRRQEICPRLAGMAGHSGKALTIGDDAFAVEWRMGDGAHLHLSANLSGASVDGFAPHHAQGRMLFETGPGCHAALQSGSLPAWSAVFTLDGVST